jgi:Fe-S-cluster containining protein
MSKIVDNETKMFLRATNRLKPNLRICNYVDKYGLTDADDGMAAVFRDYMAVIPGETRFTCKACGACCLGGKLKLPDEIVVEDKGHCMHSFPETGSKLCPIDDEKPWYCRTFPFNYVQISPTVKLLFISYNCLHYNTGKVIDDIRYLRLLGRAEQKMQIRDI